MKPGLTLTVKLDRLADIPRDFDDEETAKAPLDEILVSSKYNDPRKTYAEEDGK